MDPERFTALTRGISIMLSRRTVVSALGLSAAGLSGWVEARNKRKRKKKNKKPKRNTFGCVNVGGFCKNDGQCCSGICEGKKGKRKCKAHGTGTCDQKAPGICTAPNSLQTRCNNSDQCNCIRTTAGSNFCIDLGPGTGTVGSDCADCKQDADCEALDFPPGSACVPVFEGACADNCAGGMMCAAPCGYQPPEPE